MMCCSLRAAVYFLASNHLYFAVTQVIIPVVPLAHRGFSEGLNFTPSLMTSIFCGLYILSGIFIFLGADKESSTLLRYGGHLLALALTYRFFLLGFSMLLIEKLPEAVPLYVYNTQVVPIIFLMVVYIFYMSTVFAYHNELVDERFKALRCVDHHGLYLYKSTRFQRSPSPAAAAFMSSTSFLEE